MILNSDERKIEERKKFVGAFNDTMIRIWKERLILLGVFDTGNLLNSVRPSLTLIDADATAFTLEQSFLSYGLWQNYGTGREVPRGNPGDIGRNKVRKARRWFDKKYYSSVMNLRNFVADSFGQEALNVVSNALSYDTIRNSVHT